MLESARSQLTIVVLLAVSLSGQTATTPTPSTPQTPLPQIGWLEAWRQVTVSFGTIDRDSLGQQYYKVIGSGLVIGIRPTTAYILTAKHVFFDPDKNWHPTTIRLRYGWQDQKSVFAEHGSEIVLRDATGKDLWTSLPDGSDLAAIPAPPPIMDNQPAAGRQQIAKSEQAFEGEAIVVLGFPGIVGNEYLVRAITRGGVVAWLDPNDPTRKQFLIDANVYPGNSGGPVITVPTAADKFGNFSLSGSALLLGIVVQAPGQEADLQVRVPGQRNPMMIHQQIPLGGTGVVVPASKISELLDRLH